MLANTFSAYGPSHLAALACLPLITLALILSSRGKDWNHGLVRSLRVIIAVALLCAWPLELAWKLFQSSSFPGWGEVLPLHLCDVATFAAAIALLSRHPLAIAATVYWGLTLTIQALLTPDLPLDAPSPRFFLFFGSHSLIVASALWLLIDLVGRLRRGAWWRVFLLTQVWFVIASLVNWLGDANFGYLAHQPAKPTLIDALGPWPFYVLVMQLGVLLLWFGLSFIFERKHRPKNQEPRPKTENKGISPR